MIVYFARPLVQVLSEIKEQEIEEVDSSSPEPRSYLEYCQEYHGKTDELEPYFD